MDAITTYRILSRVQGTLIKEVPRSLKQFSHSGLLPIDSCQKNPHGCKNIVLQRLADLRSAH